MILYHKTLVLGRDLYYLETPYYKRLLKTGKTDICHETAAGLLMARSSLQLANLYLEI